MIAAALILALAVPEEPMKLACTLGFEDGTTRTARVVIMLDGGRGVSFEDAENLLGDDHGRISPNRRGWSVKRGKQGSVSTILLRSKVTKTGHGAQVRLSRNEAGQYEGRYYVNQGMMSETIAYGASGPISCDVVEGAAA
ncbi:hypothetical protein OF829_11345 [Sphingomonas sp. LB-2]|uniref:hypothetical protein n=1 Tax=Sphingomonas caeni TaxID=2984949 RepID=UPI002231EC45|nr:hypothetical protein [Sphingomonas caeni]MCW3847835.1 hypothetical protein [Sphingomonas caeni]